MDLNGNRARSRKTSITYHEKVDVAARLASTGIFPGMFASLGAVEEDRTEWKPMSYELKAVITPRDWRGLHQIRKDVLFASGRHSVSYDENHPHDRAEGNTPFLLYENGTPLGVVRLDQRGEIGIVRLVAIVQDKQRQGHGRKLNELVEAEARERGIHTLWVNAAPDAVGFYRKAGWTEQSWDPSERTGLARRAVQMIKMIGR